MTDSRDDAFRDNGDLGEAADEQFAHGLLEFLAQDDPKKQRQRVASVMARVRPQTASAWSGHEFSGSRWKSWGVAVAGVAAVVAVLLLIPRRGEPVQALLALQAAQPEAALFQYEVGVGGEDWLTGSFEVGADGERHALLYTPDHPLLTKELLRTAEGFCLHTVLDVSEKRRGRAVEKYQGGWPTWFVYGGLAGPLRSPRDWLAVLATTHELSWDEAGGVVGTLRSQEALGEVDDYALLPQRFAVRFDSAAEDRLEQLELFWDSSDSSSPRRPRAPVELCEAPPQLAPGMCLPEAVRFERAPTPKRPAWWFTKARFQEKR